MPGRRSGDGGDALADLVGVGAFLVRHAHEGHAGFGGGNSGDQHFSGSDADDEGLVAAGELVFHVAGRAGAVVVGGGREGARTECGNFLHLGVQSDGVVLHLDHLVAQAGQKVTEEVGVLLFDMRKQREKGFLELVLDELATDVLQVGQVRTERDAVSGGIFFAQALDAVDGDGDVREDDRRCLLQLGGARVATTIALGGQLLAECHAGIRNGGHQREHPDGDVAETGLQGLDRVRLHGGFPRKVFERPRASCTWVR